MRGTGGSFSHLGVHVGPGSSVRCSTYPDQSPILTIDAVSTAASLSIEGDRIGREAVEFARELAREAERFASEVERLHTGQRAADEAA